MISFSSYNCISNFLPHSINNDFLDDAEKGKDLDDINFEELNRIGETWAADLEGE
jgi:hypothetical protein